MERSKLLNQLSAKNGLIIALVTIVISLVMHFVDPLLQFTSIWVSLLTMVIFIALLVYSGKTIRTELGGYWSFGDAFKSFLIMSLIIVSLSVLYNFILVTIIDPDLPRTAGEAMDENTRSMLSKFGMQSSQIDEAMAKSGPSEARLAPTAKNLITSFGVLLAIYGVISLIMAAIMKKNPPVKLQAEE